MHTTRLAPLAVACLLVLTACDGGGGTPSSSAILTASAPPSVTPSVTPSPTPTFTPYPDVADLVVSPEGILPLTIGLPPDTNPGAAMIRFMPNYCYSEEMGITMGNLDAWVADYPTAPFSLMADDTAVWRIDVLDPDMPTTTGISIGSTIDQLQLAYPGLHEGTPGPGSRVFWVTGTQGYLVFETQDPDLGLGLDPIDTGPEAVILMRVIALAGNPDFAAANSGNAPPCPN